MAAVEFKAAVLVVRRIQQIRQWHFERRCDLDGVELEVEWRLDPADHRADPESRRHIVIGQRAEDAHAVAGEPDFLLRFAQRGLDAVFIAAFDAPARKTDLARMVLEMRRALGQEHVQFAVTRHQWHQHRGEHHARPGRQRDDMFVPLACSGGRPRQPRRDIGARQLRPCPRGGRFQILPTMFSGFTHSSNCFDVT